MSRTLPAVAAALLTLAFAWTCAAFVRQPTLASFADDSVSYLVMAQVLSPWQEASPAVAEAYVREAFYPPLFPLFLALSGAAHDVARAHAVTALILAACLPMIYALGTAWLASRWAAVAAVAVMVLLPAGWINAKGILSEPLYCLALLVLLRAAQNEGRKQAWILGVSMAALVLTRTAGLALLAGYMAWALSRRERGFGARLRMMMPPLAALAAYALWVLARPAGTADVNTGLLWERIQAVAQSADLGAALAAIVLRQANSIAEAWVGSILLYWVEGRPLRVMLAAAAGALALGGLVLRMRLGKADAWIMAAYLVTFLLWPFYDQMGRFLFPAVPVLVLYALCAAGSVARALRRPELLGEALAALLVASLAAPALAFLYQRANGPIPYPEMVDWYRTPDLPEAKARADVHLALLDDMRAIRERTRAQERVMWVAPSYVALLAERSGIPAPDSRLPPEAYRAAALAASADYVFLSAYHPRDTLSDQAWQAGLRALHGHFAVIYAGTRRDSTRVASLLFKLK